MQVIKFITAGNVDDGKSTLIGRLLVDSHAVSKDILEAMYLNNGEINLAHLTDGLKAEREQGITIDVAYKYFSTEKRKFIIADCPGHKEYTRNMITGASHADIAIIIIDAVRGITEQTRRHTFIVDMMNIPCIIFCVNKMDVVNYSEHIFLDIKNSISQFSFINKHQIEYIPVSALKGDNIVHRSKNMLWYNGPTLMYILENYQLSNKVAELPAYMQVQYSSFQNNERYFFGTLLNGEFEINQNIIIYPTRRSNKIKDIFVLGNKTSKAHHTDTIAITLHDDTEIQRGYYLVSEKNEIDDISSTVLSTRQEFSAICFWLDETPFIHNKRYFIQHHAYRTYLKCKQVEEVLDIDELKFKSANHSVIGMNSIFKAKFLSAHPLLVHDYRYSSHLGSFIIIDETSFKTLGAGIVINY